MNWFESNSTILYSMRPLFYLLADLAFHILSCLHLCSIMFLSFVFAYVDLHDAYRGCSMRMHTMDLTADFFFILRYCICNLQIFCNNFYLNSFYFIPYPNCLIYLYHSSLKNEKYLNFYCYFFWNYQDFLNPLFSMMN